MESNNIDFFARPDSYYGDRREMVKYIPPNVEVILDVGCGEGDFLSLLKKHRPVEAWGIEIVRDIAEKARAKIDHVLVGNIESEELSLPEQYFDCIVFNDVLEHLQYPWIVLLNIKRLLKKDGYVVASIPNVRYFQNIKQLIVNKEWEYVDCGVMDKTHLRFFTEKSIKRMFDSCGFEPIVFEGISIGNFPWKFAILNGLLLNSLYDMKFRNFAYIGRIKAR